MNAGGRCPPYPTVAPSLGVNAGGRCPPYYCLPLTPHSLPLTPYSSLLPLPILLLLNIPQASFGAQEAVHLGFEEFAVGHAVSGVGII
jgi:hypothetical protein